MKTIFRNLGLGVLMAGCAAVAATTTFAQDPCTAEIEAKQALYKQFTDNFDKKEVEKKKVAVTSGKQYVEKYAACADDKAIVDYINGQVPSLETSIKKIEANVKTDALFKRFDTAVKGTNNTANPSETYVAGKEIVALNTDIIVDVLLVLGSVGVEQATATTPVDTYNADTIEYAKMAIQKLETNTPSKTGNYGVYQYSFKTKDFSDGKANAFGMMNYNIGYILYYRQGKDNAEKRKEALPYLYKATQYNSFIKKNPFLYQTIGAWYLDEAIKIDKERTVKLKEAGNKDTDETLAMVANQKGYADRAIDAYSRAYKYAKEDKSQKKEYVDGLYGKLKDLYGFRYDGKTTGIDEFVATVQSKPMPDPSTTVTPVKEEVPATTTTSETTPATTKPVTPVTKPATTPTKPVSTVTPTKPEPKPAADTTTATKTKKPAPKKKGTR